MYALPFAVNGIFGIGRPRPPSRSAPASRNRHKGKGKKNSPKASKAGGTAEGGGGGPLFKEANPGDEEDELPAGYSFDWEAYRAKFGQTPIQDAITTMFAEYASLYGRIAGWTTSAVPPRMTLSEGQSIADQATNFVVNIMSPILGTVHTSKVHKLLAHVMDAIRYHGNLSTGNTADNEAAHKDDKPFYRRTNMNMATYTQQLVRQAQGAREIVRAHAAIDAEAFRTLPLVPPRTKRKRAGAAGVVGGADGGGAALEAAGGGSLAAAGGGALAAAASAGAVGSAASAGTDGSSVGGAAGGRAALVDGGGVSLEASGGGAVGSAASDGAVGSAASPGAVGASGGGAASGTVASGAGGGGALAAAGAGLTGAGGSDAAGGVAATEAGGGVALAAAGRRAVGEASGGAAGGGAASAAVAGSGRLAASRPVSNLPRITIAELSKRPGLANLGRLFGLPPHRKVPVLATVEINATFDCEARGKQLLRAAALFKTDKPWYDTIIFTLSHGDEKAANGVVNDGDGNRGRDDAAASPDADRVEKVIHVGEVRLIVRCADADYAVVCEMDPVDPEPGCPLAERDCTRLKWTSTTSVGAPVIRAIPVRDVTRVIHVIPDFKDLARRKGFGAAPAGRAASGSDRVDMRYHLNEFYPW